MQFKAIIAASLIAVVAAETGKLGDAAKTLDNPSGKTYEAKFDGSKGVSGTFTFTAGSDGKGVTVKVNVEGFKGETGPFGYHIHDQPVPAGGNCTGTLAHLDPYQRGQATPCDKSKPETCEVGDLSGKHSKISGESSSFSDSYTDLYISTKEGIGAFVGNRSVVIHRSDEKKTRLACANIQLAGNATDSAVPMSTSTATPGSGSSNSTSSSNTTKPVPDSPAKTDDNAEGSASSFGFSSILAFGGLVAGLVMAL